MRLVRLLVTATVLAPGLACSERALTPTTMTATPEGSTTGGAAACAGGVFSDTSRSGEVDHSRTLGLMRLRTIEVDVAAVRRSADTNAPLTLNLFADACLVAQFTSIEHDEQGRLIWTGTIAGAGEGSVTLIADEDVVIGSATDGRSLYQLRYAGNGVHTVMQVNPGAYPPD